MASRIIQSFSKFVRSSSLLPTTVTRPHNVASIRSIQNITFQPKIRITPVGYFLLVIPGAAFCLGSWQVKRKAWKLEVIRNLQDKINEAPISLPTDPSEITPELEYRRVVIRGTFDHSKEMLLGPRPVLHDGKHKETGSLISLGGSGYLIITPFKLSDTGETILVNRGWVDKKHANPSKRLIGQVSDEQELAGVIRLPERRNPFMPKSVGNEKSYLYRDIEIMSKVTNSLPIYVDAHDGVKGGPLAGQTRISIRNEHLSYVITWYSLSLITGCLWYRRYLNPRAFL